MKKNDIFNVENVEIQCIAGLGDYIFISLKSVKEWFLQELNCKLAWDASL